MSFQRTYTDTFLASASTITTGSFPLNDLTLVGIITGSNLSASAVSFQVSNDNIRYYSLFSEDGEVTISGVGGGSAVAISLDPGDFYAWNWVKVRQGTSGSPVTQKTANCEITLIAKTMNY